MGKRRSVKWLAVLALVMMLAVVAPFSALATSTSNYYKNPIVGSAADQAEDPFVLQDGSWYYYTTRN